MAYENNTKIILFISRSQTKIREYGHIIRDKIRDGKKFDTELFLASKLSSLIRSLTCQYIDWEEKDVLKIIDSYTILYGLSKFGFVDYPVSITEINNEGGSSSYATVLALNAETAARQSADQTLQGNIDTLEATVNALDFEATLNLILEDYRKIVDDFKPDNATVLIQITQDMLTAIASAVTHMADTTIHVTQGAKDTWNAKVSTGDSRLSDARTPLAHTHSIADITGLLTEVQNQVTNYIDSLNLTDGVTPTFGTVTVNMLAVGEPATAEVTGTADNLTLTLNIPIGATGADGADGDPFSVDATGLSSERFDALYEEEDASFSFLATNTGFLYFRVPEFPATVPDGWSTPIKFTGDNGWSPYFVTYTVDADKTVLELVDWVGGSGSKPVLTAPSNPPDPLRWYLGPTGYTVFIEDAFNVKGTAGSQGIDGEAGERFKIHATSTLADLSDYDEELAGFNVIITDVSPNVLYQKDTDASGDWVGPFPWQGDPGIMFSEVNDPSKLTVSIDITGDSQYIGLTVPDAPNIVYMIFVNGIKADVGNGVKTEAFYVSGDDGVTARLHTAITAGDKIYFNETYYGIHLMAGWIIEQVTK